MGKYTKEDVAAFAINYIFSPLIRIWCRCPVMGADWGRRIWGGIQFPIVDFESRQGVLVRVFCVSHFASREYYEKISRMISEAEGEGAPVIYELSRKKGERITEVQTRLEMQKRLPFFKLLEAEGLVLQYVDSLVPKESWINADISLEELLSSGESPFEIGRGVPQRFKSWVQVAAVNMLVEICWLVLPIYMSVKGKTQKTVLDKRNDVAINEALNCLNRSRGVMMIWGAMHLPGIRKLLAANGFREVRREWHTAYSMIPLPRV